MLDDQVGSKEHQERPEDRLDRILGELHEIRLEEVWVATVQVSDERSPDILQAPARHHSIITRDEETCEHTHITDK